MNNLKSQFLGFINTPFLFKELYGLNQIELDINRINKFDFTKLTVPDNLSLGRRIERFFEFYMNQSKNYDLIKSNIQIIKDKETLGELDFLLYDKRAKKYLHIEQIYKFYLYNPSLPNEIDRYIGPNQNDTLAKKLTKLKNKQLPLLFKDETKKYLNGINTNTIEQKVCFKGNIYVPMSFQNKNIPIINNSCIKGFYINYEEFLKQKHFKEYEYFLPKRNDWIIDSNTNDIWKTFDEIVGGIGLLLNHRKSPLVWLKEKKENKTQSFFITWW